MVRHVIGHVDPSGVQHAAFGVPTEEEKQHHYLWRIKKELPRGGYLGVFDRSHYEDVLVVRVHDLVPEDVWSKRYDEINQFEKELVDAGTHYRESRDVRLARRAEEATRRTSRPPGQVLEVQPRRRDRTRFVACISTGVSGNARQDVDRARAVVRRAV